MRKSVESKLQEPVVLVDEAQWILVCPGLMSRAWEVLYDFVTPGDMV